MEAFLLILALVFLVAGIIFAVLPPLPGPILGYVAVLFTHFSAPENSFSTFWLVFFALMTAGVTILDFLMPAVATRRFGGTRAGMWGGLIGTVVGVIAPIPFGIIIGPLLGAIIGDLIGGNQIQAAMKSGFASFVGFVIATGLKVIATVVMGVFIVWKIGGSIWEEVMNWMA